MDLKTTLKAAMEAEYILPSTLDNVVAWLESEVVPDWALESIEELITGGHWRELNDRFYKMLEFGTGGMRNRTIGSVVTAAERGGRTEGETPLHAAVGTAVLNDFSVIQATVGLYRYCERYLKSQSSSVPPRIVIAHDVRHFSRYFCELTASTWVRLGGSALIFDGPRSTPHLSFTVRHSSATTGIVITASHNPAHDNGYKVYFDDGAQVVFPHAEGIINEVYKVRLAEVAEHFEVDLTKVETLGAEIDDAYAVAVEENYIDRGVITQTRPKVVFTPIHGAGSSMVPRLLERSGADVEYVQEQMISDPQFSTVRSPNPENAEALSMGVELARRCGADVVMATDPDADRMGVAVRGREGEFTLLTGNMIGSILAEYRIRRMKEAGVLPRTGTRHAALIKTFVTTPLQAAIAETNGLKIVDTLTGFKWIGEKLRVYQEVLETAMREASDEPFDYTSTPMEKRRELLLKHSTYCVFGGEESYGYLASDLVRDKDANAAVLMFTEVAAWLKKSNRTFIDYLDEIYLRYGYYLEDLINVYYEGAAGAAKIRRILESYRADPPRELGGCRVEAFKDFGVETFYDADGAEIPKQDFYFLELDNGYQFAVRGSGTEPKIKFYLFAREDVTEPAVLEDVKAATRATLDRLKAAIETEARSRAVEP